MVLPDVLSLLITYSPTYPDELPEIGIECEEGDLDGEEEEQLVMGLIGAARDSLGMVSWLLSVEREEPELMDYRVRGQAMVYTLSLYLRESLAELLRERKERIDKAESEKARLEEEVRLIPLRTLPHCAEDSLRRRRD